MRPRKASQRSASGNYDQLIRVDFQDKAYLVLIAWIFFSVQLQILSIPVWSHSLPPAESVFGGKVIWSRVLESASEMLHFSSNTWKWCWPEDITF